MSKVRSIIYQILAYSFFMVFIAYLSSRPIWQHTQPDEATVKISIRHAGKIVGECRSLNEEEMKRLPANMKVVQQCPRERSPVSLTIELDGQPLYESVARPSGLQKDGVSTFYARFAIPAGEHKIRARLKDDANNPEVAYLEERHLNVQPRQVMVIDFKDGFLFK